ncbi:unnamed protein product [Calypogeia fissa]
MRRSSTDGWFEISVFGKDLKGAYTVVLRTVAQGRSSIASRNLKSWSAILSTVLSSLRERSGRGRETLVYDLLVDARCCRFGW